MFSMCNEHGTQFIIWVIKEKSKNLFLEYFHKIFENIFICANYTSLTTTTYKFTHTLIINPYTDNKLYIPKMLHT